jgi:hypothetical protein
MGVIVIIIVFEMNNDTLLIYLEIGNSDKIG